MPRIAIAGFQHETNTFVTTPTRFEDFEVADSWPAMLQGAAVIAGTAGINLPIAGFAEAARHDRSIELVPVLWCAAEPAGRVTADAFERVAGMIVEGVRTAMPLDGLYLDLHGAMVSETREDGEGTLLARLRAVVGDDLPITVSLDLHANITPAMVHHATQIAVFRTYPHLDMGLTGARCLPLLLAQIAGDRPAKAFRRAPFLIPLHAQFTGAEPCRGLYALLEDLPAGVHAEIALGFTAADTPDTGPSIVAYAPDVATAEAAADRLLAALVAAEDAFDCTMLPPAEAVRAAMAALRGPVVIADVQDNPGAGAASDSTALLEALVAEGAQGAALALLNDPAMAARAHAAGIGGVIDGPLGGNAGLPGQYPFTGRFRVQALTDGQCAFTGAMYGGAVAHLGPTAVLAVESPHADVRVVVSSRRSQALDRAIFTHAGIDPTTCRIVCVKSTVHFRADFDPVSAQTLVTAAPGGFPCDLAHIPYRRLRPGTRLGPGGPSMRGAS